MVVSLAGFLGLGSIKGKDQFDLFADALGLALPGNSDSDTEGCFKSLEGSATTSESRPESSDSGVTNKENNERLEVRLLTKGALTRIGMAGIMKMNPFAGRGDGKESPSDFLSDVEMAARSWDATYGADTDQPDASKIAIFRQNLDRDGDGWYWWSCILANEEKKAFPSIKKAFLARYGAEKNKAISRFNIQNELMCLQQKQGQSIVDYVHEAERLSERVPADMNDMLAMAFIRGLQDQKSRRRVSYDLRDCLEFTFSKAVHMVKSWYQEIGVPDPFNRFGVGFRETPKAPAPIYAAPAAGTLTAREAMTSGSKGTPDDRQTPNPL